MTPTPVLQPSAIKEEQVNLLHQAENIFSLAQSVIDQTYLTSA